MSADTLAENTFDLYVPAFSGSALNALEWRKAHRIDASRCNFSA